MRYRGWMLLFAGLLAAPQAGVSAEAWPGGYSETGRYAPGAFDPSQTQRYRPYAQTRVPAYPYAAAEMPRPASPPRFRYRPWDGPAPGYPQPLSMPLGASAPSYWGGVPTANALPDRFRPLPASPYRPGPAQNFIDSQDRVDARRMQALAGAGEFQRYRFRPQQEAPATPVNGGYRYHALPMQIPDNYVYRPLNPVAKASRMPMAPMPEPGYRSGYDGWNRFAAQPYRFMPPPQWTYLPAMNRPWAAAQQNFASGYRPPVWMPTAPGYPPAYAFNGFGPNRYPYPVAERQPLPLPAPNRRYAQHWAPAAQPFGYPRWQRPMPPAPYAGPGGWQRTAQLPPPPPVKANRFGTDWYDGQGDGEGAWYRLTLESAPALTQSSPPQPTTTGEWGD